MTSLNPRMDRRNTSIRDVEARAEQAQNAWDVLLWREPNLWDAADVGDKLIGILQVAEEHPNWWEDEPMHFPLVQGYEWARRSSTGRDRGKLIAQGWWWTYSDLFNRWFLASTPALAQGREAVAAGISDAESYHRAAMAGGGVAKLWHRIMPIEEWQGVSQLPLVRMSDSEWDIERRRAMLFPGGYSIFDGYRLGDLQLIGLSVFKSNGTWGIAYSRQERELALSVRLPDNRIAGFFGSPWGNTVASAFGELPPRGPIFKPEVRRTTFSANLALWGLHFRRPEYYENVHWDPDPDLAKNIAYTAMIALNRAQFIYTQSDLESELRRLVPQ